MSRFLEVARSRVLVVDGAMGASLQERDLTLDDFDGLEGCNEVLVRTRPDVIKDLHAEFLDVGCDAVETDSFGGAPWVLDEYGLGAETEELNRQSAAIAREACDEADGERFVIGSIGPGTRSPTLSLTNPSTAGDWIDFDAMVAGYLRQVRGLLAGGSDVLLVETVFDLLQAKAAIAACHDGMAAEGITVPLMVQVTIEQGINTMLLGSEIGAAVTALDPLGVDVIGMNCATGPDDMREHVRYLSRNSRKPISIIPNAGMPEMIDGVTCYPLSPEALASAHAEFVSDLGVQIVGGCCGTTPEHLRHVVDTVKDLTPAPRDVEWTPALASLYSSVPLKQELSFHIIGERLNANGSKAFREHLLAGDLDQMLSIAKTQTGEGANSLDVCVDYVGRDGSDDMVNLVSHLATKSTLPLVVDSTEVEVVEAALKRLAGRAVINSVNLEDGRRKADVLFPLAKRHGSAVIALAIDEEGQARTTPWKVDVCKRIADIGLDEYGLEPADLIFDTLTFPLGSGQEDLRKDGLATLEAIEQIKAEVPGCHTTLGVSNVSFGLSPAARQALNSVFLHEAVARGLDSAIVHASKILPLAKIDDETRVICEDLIHDRRGRAGQNGTGGPDYDPLHRLMAVFEGVSGTISTKESLAELPLVERLEQRIIDGERDGLDGDLAAAMSDGLAPLDIINTHLLAGMKVVGDRFGAGEMQLPFVLQSAETMKAAVAYLEPHMDAADAGGKARVVLATVKGDVHDIGKNLVDIILTNNGYDVRNIGIKQPIDAIVQAAEDFEADAIGLSGLLVKSTVVMRDDLDELTRRKLDHFPVLLGGAALTRNYVEIDLRERYGGPLFYCKDAFSGLHVMDQVAARKSGAPVDETWGREIGQRRVASTGTIESSDTSEVVAPTVSRTVEVPEPPFWGTRVTRGVPLDDIAEYLNLTTLFRNQWGFDRDQREDGEAALRKIMATARAESLLVPEAVHGYFACQSEGNDLLVYAAPDSGEVAARFTYPRQTRGKRLCIPDFFRSVESGERDVIAFHAVTMGRRVSERAAELFAENAYTEYLYLHGLGVEMAEALAEMWHKRIRAELGIDGDDAAEATGLFKQGYQGSRYSFGYAACPDLESRAPLFDLLDAGRVGLELSEEFQLVPEQSTDAMIVHHPEAKYFNAR
ncbi:methionine synthase [Euzebya tangerina]|uniref:methionine synthase n=1 Tax=Euzebya tangerina TaxID=591198 RepID=UPI000E31D386|nr:methionine synthase [Euzebya tangerina]